MRQGPSFLSVTLLSLSGLLVAVPGCSCGSVERRAAAPEEKVAAPPPMPTARSTARSGACGLERPAFCETFETPHPGGRGGDLDERIWSMARWGHFAVAHAMFVKPTVMDRTDEGDRNFGNKTFFCGRPLTQLEAPNDVKFCGGQLNEVLHDAGGFGINSMRIRQPFDFTGRTGTLMFDLDAKKNDGFEGHGWWTEFWITEDPAPIPYHGAPTVGSYPRNGVGFVIQPVLQDCFDDGKTQVGRVVIVKNHVIVSEDAQDNQICTRAKDMVLNRFKLLISREHAEVWASDWNEPDELKLVSKYQLNLNFTRGYVHLQHSQYNANKAANSRGLYASPAQTFRWDNVGFDGPVYVVPRSYDIPDQLEDVEIESNVVGKSIGYYLDEPRTFRFEGVDLTDAARALFNFNYPSAVGNRFRYRFNGKQWHTFDVPKQLDEDMVLRAFTVEVPLAELVSGTNVLEAEDIETKDLSAILGNMDLTIETTR